MQYFGYSVNIIFVIVALLLFQRIFLFHVQFVNGMNTSYVQIRNELASEQLIKVQFQVAMSGRYIWYMVTCHHLAAYRVSRNRFSAIPLHDYLPYCGIFLAHFLMKIDRNIISSLQYSLLTLCASWLV